MVVVEPEFELKSVCLHVLPFNIERKEEGLLNFASLGLRNSLELSERGQREA